MGKLLLGIILAAAVAVAYQEGLLDRFVGASYNEEELLEKAGGGDVNAMARLGYAYDTGAFGKRDAGKAAEWLGRAASRHSIEAALLAGILHFNGGPGLAPDYAAASNYLKIAADKGIGEAHYYLGIMSERGLGGSRNYRKAYYSYQIAGRLGGSNDAEAISRTGKVVGTSARREILAQINNDLIAYERLKDSQLSSELQDIIRSRTTIHD